MSLKEKFQNGKIPVVNLLKIDTGQFLEKNASQSYMRMKTKAKNEGVNIDLTGNSSGYRICGNKGDYNSGLSNGQFTQWYAWELYKSGKGNLAANPSNSSGCSSNHGWGIAIDVKGYKARQWIRKNGEKYGWWWSGGTFSSIEDWHFDYDIVRDTFRKTKPQINKILIYSMLATAVVGLGFSLYYFSSRNKR